MRPCKYITNKLEIDKQNNKRKTNMIHSNKRRSLKYMLLTLDRHIHKSGLVKYGCRWCTNHSPNLEQSLNSTTLKQSINVSFKRSPPSTHNTTNNMTPRSTDLRVPVLMKTNSKCSKLVITYKQIMYPRHNYQLVNIKLFENNAEKC